MDTPEHPDLGWTLTEEGFDASGQHHGETIFTIGNGQHCLRGGFEEGYPGERTRTEFGMQIDNGFRNELVIEL